MLTGLAFVLVGLAFKFGAAPFHMWLPDVYQGAPTAVTLFIGSAPKLAAFAMAYRLLEGAAGPLDAYWRDMVAVLAPLGSEGRRVGQECVSTGKSRGVHDQLKKKN